MRLFRPWNLMRCLYPGAFFRIKTSAKVLYLTFDDGPDPESTPAILRLLGKHNCRAVFFCNGESASAFPGLVKEISSGGHLTGNHSFSHADGWRTSHKDYTEDVYKADEYTSATLFRPPYGHLKLRQFRELKKKYKIVFWDLMPYDFDKKMTREKMLDMLKRKMRPGSIIVLHDSPGSKAAEMLEEFLIHAKKQGYRFDSSLCVT